MYRFAYRDHQPAAEARFQLHWIRLVSVGVEEAALLDGFHAESFLFQKGVQFVCFGRGKSNEEFFGKLQAEFTVFEPIAAGFHA